MPNWQQVNEEIRAASRSPYDLVRRKYLAKLHKHTKRNVIIYYSGWLQKPDLARNSAAMAAFGINDNDKNGFMAAIKGLNRKQGLDLILHTPGGEVAATESLVDYLRSMFDIDIRAIIPQLAMSGGTMISCASKEIFMGKHSSLGPIDPQIAGMAAHAVRDEFRQAIAEAKADPASIPFWGQIISKYPPTLLGACDNAIAWSTQLAKAWLKTGMFKGEKGSTQLISRIVNGLGNHAVTKSHSRHIPIAHAKALGLKVTAIESDPVFQDLVLTVHHATIQTFNDTPSIKIIENHLGVAMVQQVQVRQAST